MDEKLKNIFKIMGKNKDKKFKGIQEYLRQKFAKDDIRISTVADIESYIDELDEADLENIIDIINEKYFNNYPFYIYNYTAKVQNIIEELEQKINNQFKEGTIKISERYDFRSMRVVDKNKEFFIELMYTIYELNPSINGRVRGENGKNGKGKITFLKNENIVLFEVGDISISNEIYKFLMTDYSDIVEITPYLLNSDSFNYDGPAKNDKMTVFLLELITNKVKQDNKCDVINYSKMGFSNIKNRDGLNRIRVGGSNLLNAYEVAEQIRNGFNLKMVEFTIVWIINKENAINITINIMLQDVLKMTITRSDNYMYNIEVIKYLYEKINDLKSEGITLGTANNILQKYFSKVENRLEMQIKLDRKRCLEKLSEVKELEKSMEKIKEIYNKL